MKYITLVVMIMNVGCNSSTADGVSSRGMEWRELDGVQCIVFDKWMERGGVSCNWDKYNKEQEK